MVRANISWSTKQLVKAKINGSITFENSIQRGYVWDRRRQIQLIDSILRNYSIPPMYTVKTDIDAPAPAKKGSKIFDCIDGKQRVEALRAFMQNEFALECCDLFDDVDLNGLTYDELPDEWRDAFDAYTFTVYFFTDISDDEIAEQMSRLNDGKPMSGVENARIKALNLPKIRELAAHPLFAEVMSETAIKGYSNEDVILKLVLLYNDKYELSTKNVKAVYESNDFTDDVMNASLIHAMDVFSTALPSIAEGHKKNRTWATKKTTMVSLIDFVRVAGISSGEAVATVVNKICEDKTLLEDYKDLSTSGSNHALFVHGRRDFFMNVYTA